MSHRARRCSGGTANQGLGYLGSRTRRSLALSEEASESSEAPLAATTRQSGGPFAGLHGRGRRESDPPPYAGWTQVGTEPASEVEDAGRERSDRMDFRKRRPVRWR